MIAVYSSGSYIFETLWLEQISPQIYFPIEM